MKKILVYTVAACACVAALTKYMTAEKPKKEVHDTLKKDHDDKIAKHLAKAKKELGQNLDPLVEQWVQAYEEAYIAALDLNAANTEAQLPANKDNAQIQEKRKKAEELWQQKINKSDEIAIKLVQKYEKDQKAKGDLIARFKEYEKEEIAELKKHIEPEFEKHIDFEEQALQELESMGLKALFVDKSKYPG